MQSNLADSSSSRDKDKKKISKQNREKNLPLCSLSVILAWWLWSLQKWKWKWLNLPNEACSTGLSCANHASWPICGCLLTPCTVHPRLGLLMRNKNLVTYPRVSALPLSLIIYIYIYICWMTAFIFSRSWNEMLHYRNNGPISFIRKIDQIPHVTDASICYWDKVNFLFKWKLMSLASLVDIIYSDCRLPEGGRWHGLLSQAHASICHCYAKHCFGIEEIELRSRPAAVLSLSFPSAWSETHWAPTNRGS